MARRAKKAEKPERVERGMRGTFRLPLGEIIVDDRLNPRQRSGYGRGSDEPGEEQATLERLAASLRAVGQLENCVVERVPEGWRLRAGYRRYHAAKLAGLPELIVAEYVGPIDVVPGAENVGRGRLTSPEIAREVMRLCRPPPDGPGLSDHQIADALTLSRPSVGNYRRVMEKAHPRIIAYWMRAPGAFRFADLLMIIRSSKIEQLQWLTKRYQVELSEPEEQAVRKIRNKQHRIGKADVRALKGALERGVYDKRGEAWKAGAYAVIEYFLEGDEIDP